MKGSVAAETFKEPSQREDAKKLIKKQFEERYASGKNKWFFQPLRVRTLALRSMFHTYLFTNTVLDSDLFDGDLRTSFQNSSHVHHVSFYAIHPHAPLLPCMLQFQPRWTDRMSVSRVCRAAEGFGVSALCILNDAVATTRLKRARRAGFRSDVR